MPKKILLLITLLFVGLLPTACATKNAVVENSIPVETTTVWSENFAKTLSYVGVITDASVTKYSFKSTATLAQVPVTKGQYVESGTVLAVLDPSDLALQVEAAQYQMDSAYAVYQKAQAGAQSEDLRIAQINLNTAKAALDLATRNYEAIQSLAAAGAISDIELAQNKLQLEQAQGQYTQAQATLEKASAGRPEDISSARAQYDTARINYHAYQKQLDETTLVATQSGYVVDVLFKPGELVPAGNPAVLVRAQAQIMEVGMAQQDIGKIALDTPVTVMVDGHSYAGSISNIGQLPDSFSRTFPVEITLKDAPNEGLQLGATGEVDFVIGQQEGILLPIAYVANDGQDYVYLVQDGRARRVNLTMEGIYNDRVYVPSLKAGDCVITNGVKGLRDGCAVTVPEAEVDHAEAH